jgi:hypothetical protein
LTIANQQKSMLFSRDFCNGAGFFVGWGVMQRGRRSVASLTTFPVIEHRSRLGSAAISQQARARNVHRIGRACRASQASRRAAAAALAQSILLARKLARDPSKAKEWDRTVRTQMTLTRSLRMTPQSRIDARAAGRQNRPPPSYYDVMRLENAVDEE